MKMNAEKLTEQFWIDPEGTVNRMLEAMSSGCQSYYETACILRDISNELYPGEGIPYGTAQSWLDAARSKGGARGRRPNLRNGVKLFRTILRWNEKS